MKEWWRNFRPGIASWVLFLLVRLLGMTWRIRVVGHEQVKAMTCGRIICGWHGRSAVAGVAFRGLGYWAIISRSRDGEMQNRIFSRLGFRTIRGSTGRGGARALIESIRVLREGGTMTLTPDGPRGPGEVVQEGVIMMSRKTGAALIPIGIAAHSAIYINSWDRYMFPYPFTKAMMILGEPIFVPADADEQVAEEYRLRLEAAIKVVQRQAEEGVGSKPVPARRDASTLGS